MCALPDFTQQRSVNITTEPFALCFASYYLLVGGESGIHVKLLNNMNENVQTLKMFKDILVCDLQHYRMTLNRCMLHVGLQTTLWVMKYTWPDNGTPAYVKSYCSIHADFAPSLSLSSTDVLAICDHHHKVNVYALEWMIINGYDI